MSNSSGLVIAESQDPSIASRSQDNGNSLVRRRLALFGDNAKNLDQNERDFDSQKNLVSVTGKSCYGIHETEARTHHGSLVSGSKPRLPPKQTIKSISVHQVPNNQEDRKKRSQNASSDTPDKTRMSTISIPETRPESFQFRFGGIWGPFVRKGNYKLTDKERSKGWQGNQDEVTLLSSKSRENQKKKAFLVASELMSSESVFVGVLRLLNVDFREFIQKGRQDSSIEVLPEADFNKIFSNFRELQAINEDILKDFESRIKNWNNCPVIADVLMKKGPFLKLYYNYIRNFQHLNDHLNFCCKTYPRFQKLVQEFEKKEECKNLKIPHYLLKPVQRLPQYRLLLHDYLKHLDQSDEDFKNTLNALKVVEDVASQAEFFIKNEENFQRLLQLQYQLGDYELIQPGRQLLKEGELRKINRKGDDLRYFILTTDCLFYTCCTESFLGGGFSLKLRYEIPLTSLEVKVSHDVEEFQREFSINSPVRSCTLRATSVTERNGWVSAIEEAKKDLETRSKSFQESSKEISVTDSPTKLGLLAPVWIQDKRVTMCQRCNSAFSLSLRRHHCRACGQVVCKSCSGNKAPLKYLKFEPARVCNTCFETLSKEYESNSEMGPKLQKSATGQAQEKRVPQWLKKSGLVDGAQMRGYLKRQTRHSWCWKKYWFVLQDKVLYTHKAPEDRAAIESLPILGFALETGSQNGQSQENEATDLTFRLVHLGSGALVFAAETPEIKDRWVTALRAAITLDDV